MIRNLRSPTDSPLIAFAGGGTGGHLYPAIAIAQELRRLLPSTRFVFFGTQRRIDHHILSQVDCRVVRQELPPISAAPWRWPRVYLGLRRSCRVCREQFEADRPAVVIGTGGLASVPAVREAHRAGIATALLNPDAQPGRANRNLSGMADVVFAQWEETAACLPRRTPVAVLGCPVRPEFLRADRAAGIARFGLDPLRNTLLVTGASQGARTINDAILANLDFFESLDNWQILHLTGDRDHEEVRRGYAGRSVRATVLAYTDQMADALAAADLVVSRAGASTLAELTAVGRAGILMPYPYDRGRHQLTNARCLERAGAARIVTDAIDSVVNGEALCGALRELTSRNDLRASMASAARRMGRGDAAERIAERILNLVAPREAQAYDESMESVCAPTR